MTVTMDALGRERRQEGWGEDSFWLVTYFKHMLLTNNNNNEDIIHKLPQPSHSLSFRASVKRTLRYWGLGTVGTERKQQKDWGCTPEKHDFQGCLSHFFTPHGLSHHTRKRVAHGTQGDFSLTFSEAPEEDCSWGELLVGQQCALNPMSTV